MPVGEAELQDAWNQVLDRFRSLITSRSRADIWRWRERSPACCHQEPAYKKPDSRQKMLDYAKDMGIDYIPMNGKDVPSTTGELDMVMSHDVLEHLHDPPRYLFAELMKRVRTGGYVYVTVPNHVNIRKRIAVLFGETNHPEFERY